MRSSFLLLLLAEVAFSSRIHTQHRSHVASDVGVNDSDARAAKPPEIWHLEMKDVGCFMPSFHPWTGLDPDLSAEDLQKIDPDPDPIKIAALGIMAKTTGLALKKN